MSRKKNLGLGKTGRMKDPDLEKTGTESIGLVIGRDSKTDRETIGKLMTKGCKLSR